MQDVDDIDISFDEDMLNDVLNEIYEEKVKPKNGEIPKKLFDATVGKFEEATAKGMSKSKNEKIADDKAFLKKYRHTIDVFSAFRSHAYAKQMADQLYDKKGNVIPFEEWVEKTKDIQTHFNKTWLKTEYDTAVIRGQQAADWRMFEDQKEDYPRLRWMPTASATPREVHRVFWEAKLTLPVNDRFWDRHHPGDQWNCKCWLEQTTDPSTPIKDRPSAKDYPKPADGLDSRATKEMFSRKHPYFSNCKTCKFNKDGKIHGNDGTKAIENSKYFNSDENINGNCMNCSMMNLCLSEMKTNRSKNNEKIIKERSELSNDLENDSNYKLVKFNEQTGGLMATHIDHNFDEKKGWYETTVQKAGYDYGDAVILEKEDHTVLHKKNTEGTWNGLKFEIAGAENGTENNVRNALKHCASKKTTEVAVIFFPEEYDKCSFYKGLAKYNGLAKKNDGQYKKFKVIVLVQKDGSIQKIAP